MLLSVVFYAFLQLFLVEVRAQARLIGNGTACYNARGIATSAGIAEASRIPISGCCSSVSPSVSPSPTVVIATTSDSVGATTLIQPATPYTNTILQPTPVTPSVRQSVDPCSNAVSIFNNDATCITALTATDHGCICRGRCRTLANNILSACEDMVRFIRESYVDACVGGKVGGAKALKGKILVLSLMTVFAGGCLAKY